MQDLIFLVVVAGLCGAAGAALAGRRRRDILSSIVLGFFGALFGMLFARQLRLPQILTVQGFPLLWSILGAAMLTWVMRLVGGGRRRR